MARQRHLNNAPITEAIIDFRVVLASGFDVKKFLEAKETLCKNYPKNETIKLVTASFGTEKDGKTFIKPPQDEETQGYFFKSEDEKNIAQFRLDGFTYNRLHPYTNWENVLGEAKSLWGVYCSIASLEKVKRVAVRYINKLDIELPISDFSEYLVAPPNVASSLPQAISQFLMRMTIHDGDKIVNLIQTMGPSDNTSNIQIILDIDAFKISEPGLNVRNIWSDFEELHTLKNRMFFESITEKVAEKYE